MTFTRPGQLLLLGLLSLAIPFSTYWSWRFATAARTLQQGHAADIQAAHALAPDWADPMRALAQIDPDTMPQSASAALRRNPYDTQSSIELALWQELHEQIPAAEQTLLLAAQHDRTYPMSWALTNFYFRQGRDEEFWRYATGAAQHFYGDFQAVLELCWQKRPDGLWLLQHVVPRETWALKQFINFVLRHDALAAIVPAVLQLTDRPPVPIESAIGALDWCWANNHPAEAAAIWQRLLERKLIPVTKPPAPELLSNVNFRSDYGQGFDWHLQPKPLITLFLSSAGLRITGDEAAGQHFLAYQPVILTPGQHYELKWQWRGEEDLTSAQGLHWAVLPALTRREQSAVRSAGFQKSDTPQTWSFTAPDEPEVLLYLEYSRLTGMRSLSGTLYVQSVSLQAAAGR